MSGIRAGRAASGAATPAFNACAATFRAVNGDELGSQQLRVFTPGPICGGEQIASRLAARAVRWCCKTVRPALWFADGSSRGVTVGT
ncbi:hypothetical protein KCP73_14275 [Salmonella enterica subsp. enterica]|nr:hypothetical protein KCP73_14275 [Salmonella enterica subsp. enterica]